MCLFDQVIMCSKISISLLKMPEMLPFKLDFQNFLGGGGMPPNPLEGVHAKYALSRDFQPTIFPPEFL